MTAPAPVQPQPADPGQPAPAGGQTPPVGQPTPPPKPDPKPAEPQTGQDDKVFDADYVKSLREEAKGHRTAKEAAEKQRAELEETLAALRKALDPNAAPEADAAKVAEQAIAERDADRVKLRRMETKALAEKAGRKAGADVDLLMDSNGFTTALYELDDTSSTHEADVTAAVAAALKANPRLKATPAVPARSVTDPSSVDPARVIEPGMDRMRAAYAAIPPPIRS